MTKVIGVRFRTAGKIYFFSPGEFEIKQGDHVIVETARGIEYGRVVSAPKEVDDDSVVQPLKSVIRIATEQDEKTVEKNRQKEKEAFKICQEKIRKHGLDMKLIEAEYTFDNNKVLFYFTADGRIDFRELVKDLAAVFRTRIELRQIGVRDETKIRGGIGICGRPLCCSTYLTEFAAVSIKMAKEQNLSLNPTKISGVCGRLMCCLTNEEETYEVLNSQLPSVGDNVTTSDGLTGTVHSLSVLRRLVKVIVNLENDEKEIREYKADDLKFRPRRKKQKVSKEEQNLSLNPTKISGVCGRLMCCLTNEEETYEVLNSQLPSVGDNVTTSDGLTGTVHSLSVLRRLVKVIVNLENDEKEIREYKADDLKFRPRRKKQKVSKEEQKKLAALERMEKKEGASKLDDK